MHYILARTCSFIHLVFEGHFVPNCSESDAAKEREAGLREARWGARGVGEGSRREGIFK